MLSGARKKLREAQPQPEVHDGGPVEAAQFIVSQMAELGLLARRHRLETLGYLLDMAKLEADDVVRRHLNGQRF